MNRRQFSRGMLALACAAGFASAAVPVMAADLAGDYPDKPIHFVVPFAPGGAVDILARMIGEHLTQQMGQTVIVDNRPGANGNLATASLARMKGDGYTILMGGNGLASNTALYPNAGYDMLRDLAPVAYIGYSPLIMVVPAQSKVKSLQDIINMAKAAPGSVTFASAGSGSAAHLGSELLKYVAKVDMLHVPYRGGAPAIVDLLGNRVSFMLLDPPQAMPQIRSGKLRAVVVGSPKRLDLLPDVPTTAEAGYPKVEATVWWGIVTQAKTPKPIIAKLNTEINKTLALPEMQTRLKELGVTTQPESTAQFDHYLRAEIAKWITVVKQAGIKGE
jgi:tripartite-type tricarboxylate transporter receptor subunit TctC